MPSTRFRPQLLPLLLLPLLSTGCATRSIAPPPTRIERPTLPTLDAELTKTERLTPLTAQSAPPLVTIAANVLEELYERLAEAIAAVGRGNARAGGVLLERRCTKAILETGRAEQGCPPAS